MSPRRVLLTDYLASKADRAIEVETSDGQVFTVPAPEAWPDAAITAAKADDPPTVGRALLGDERYDTFCAAGGSGVMLLSLVKDTLGLAVGESPASSSS